MASKKPTSTKAQKTRVLLLGIHAPYNKSIDREDYFDEFLSLVKTAGIEYHAAFFTKLRSIDKGRFLTKGKLQDLLTECEKNDVEEIICSEILTPLQERNLEEMTGKKVFDREELILEIFRNSAHSAEGKIQVEMAEIEYFKTRVAGKGTQLAQQAGHIGARGPGETAKEYILRHLAEKTRQAKKRLKTLQKSRDIQRKRRLESNVPLVCLVGYTNAGKSTILNQLTKSDVLVEDKLFATLDTTTRELFVDKKVLLSDTVGFISHLPHHLIEAFKSTLDELQYAHLLLHVVDTSNHAWKNQIQIVEKTLCDLGDENKKVLYIFNKMDKVPEESKEALLEEIQNYQPHVITDATSKEGLKELVEFLKNYKF
jgi:GTPase